MSTMGALPQRVAVLETKVDDLEREQQRARDRLDSVEGDRATVRILAHQIQTLAGSIEQIATRSADKAVERAIAERDAEVEKVWRFRLALLGSGTALGGFLVGLAGLLVHLAGG